MFYVFNQLGQNVCCDSRGKRVILVIEINWGWVVRALKNKRVAIIFHVYIWLREQLIKSNKCK